jgi:hypothetical protein
MVHSVMAISVSKIQTVHLIPVLTTTVSHVQLNQQPLIVMAIHVVMLMTAHLVIAIIVSVLLCQQLQKLQVGYISS